MADDRLSLLVKLWGTKEARNQAVRNYIEAVKRLHERGELSPGSMRESLLKSPEMKEAREAHRRLRELRRRARRDKRKLTLRSIGRSIPITPAEEKPAPRRRRMTNLEAAGIEFGGVLGGMARSSE